MMTELANKSLCCIRKKGDLLETRLFAEGCDFGLRFAPYAEVWYSFVFPNRSVYIPWMDCGDWSEFARRNYTALLRCYGAYRSYRTIEHLCECAMKPDANPADTTLALHGELFAFYMSIGTAVDNLQRAATAAPESEKFKLNVSATCSDGACYCDLRNRLSHAWIIPLFFDGGLPSVDSVQFSPDEAPWTECGGSIDCLSDRIETVWNAFERDMQNAWRKLNSHLLDTFGDLHTTRFVHTLPSGAGSGAPIQSVLPLKRPASGTGPSNTAPPSGYLL